MRAASQLILDTRRVCTCVREGTWAENQKPQTRHSMCTVLASNLNKSHFMSHFIGWRKYAVAVSLPSSLLLLLRLIPSWFVVHPKKKEIIFPQHSLAAHTHTCRESERPSIPRPYFPWVWRWRWPLMSYRVRKFYFQPMLTLPMHSLTHSRTSITQCYAHQIDLRQINCMHRRLP